MPTSSDKSQITPDLVDDYKRTFQSDFGKRVFESLCMKYWLTIPIVADCQGDVIEVAYRDGQRSVILDIMNVVEFDKMEAARQTMRAQEADRQYMQEITHGHR